jgi:DNA-binding MarR family transcriptional regulator
MMANFFIYARDNGLTMAQFGTLLRLFHRGACGVSDIGSELGVTNSAASQMLERLVQLKLVTRSEDPVDRRVKQIVITDKGSTILKDSSQAFHAWMEDVAKSLTPTEQEQIRDALSLLIDKARQFETTHP